MSDVAAKLIEEWLEENPPPEPQMVGPQTIADLVQQNFFALIKDGKIKPEKLQAIAEGEEPTRNDLYKISSVVTSLTQTELLDLHKQTFGHPPLSNGERDIEKRRNPNGASNE